MTISSMTGYARTEETDGVYRWAWEIRSVNGKGLDIRTRLPSGFEGLDSQLRTRVAARLGRGNINISLQLNRESTALRAIVNRDLLDSIVSLRQELKGVVADQPPSLESLLAVRGLIELTEEDESTEIRAARENSLLNSFDSVVDSLKTARDEEGRRVESMLATVLAEIADLVTSARNLAALQPDALREKLRTQVAELMEAASTLSEERLLQEAAILATKADIREELDRLLAHVASAHDLLTATEPVGRRFEFLCQELSREANTLCAKSNDLDLTRIGLSLKAAIDQVREQVQNVE